MFVRTIFLFQHRFQEIKCGQGHSITGMHLILGSRSWDEFYEGVLSALNASQRESLGPVRTAGYDEAKRYFTDAAQNLDRINNEKRCWKGFFRNKTAMACSDLLVRLPNIVLERLEGKSINFTVESRKRRLHLTDAKTTRSRDELKRKCCVVDFLGRLPAEQDFPECGVSLLGRSYVHNAARRSFQTEFEYTDEDNSEILKYDSLPVLPTTSELSQPVLNGVLPGDRIGPLRVAFVVGLLGTPTSGKIEWPDVIEQFALHLQAYLELTPGRQVMFGVLTNLEKCCFVAASVWKENHLKRQHTYEYHYGGVANGKEAVARELAKFCATNPGALGLNPALFRSPHLQFQGDLAREKTMMLTKEKWCDAFIALKTSIYKCGLELERALLLYLEARGVAQVPRIHRAAQEDLYPRYSESCTAFSTVTNRIKKRITLKQMLQVWGILRSLHSVGIVHRNVRAANMMCDEPGVMYLTNFDSAQFYTDTLSPDMHEELVTASGKTLAELQALYNPRNVNTASAAVLEGNLSTLPADEACAIIYAAYQVNFHDSLVSRELGRDVQQWSRDRDRWTQQWQYRSYYLTDAVQGPINIIVASLAQLREHRTDSTFTEEQTSSAVRVAVEAVYQLKAAVRTAEKEHEEASDAAQKKRKSLAVHESVEQK